MKFKIDWEIFSLLVPIFTAVSFLFLYYSLPMYVALDSVPYDDSNIMRDFNMSMLDGVRGIYYTDDVITSINLNNDSIGMYWFAIDVIKINVNESLYNKHNKTIESVLCHEACHRVWHKSFTDEDKEYWEERYIKWLDYNLTEQQEYIIDAGELHSYWCGYNYKTVCYGGVGQ